MFRDAQKTRRSVRGASAIRRAGSDASARLEKALKEAEECVGECAAMWDDGTFCLSCACGFFVCVRRRCLVCVTCDDARVIVPVRPRLKMSFLFFSRTQSRNFLKPRAILARLRKNPK